jgi:hypothetical protein
MNTKPDPFRPLLQRGFFVAITGLLLVFTNLAQVYSETCPSKELADVLEDPEVIAAIHAGDAAE